MEPMMQLLYRSLGGVAAKAGFRPLPLQVCIIYRRMIEDVV